MMRIIGDTLDGIIILIARQNIINAFILTNRVFISNVWSRFYEVFIKDITNLSGWEKCGLAVIIDCKDMIV